IQQMTLSGLVNTLPGVGRDLAVGPAGNLFVASGPQVLQLTGGATPQRIAGDGSYLFRGDGGQATSARMNGPVAIALGASGAFYIADQSNLRIRLVNTAGIISTVAGNGTAGTADGELNSPGGVAAADNGTAYIADQNNDRILQLS